MKYRLLLEELFRLGRENSLRLHASRMSKSIAGEKMKDALTNRLPDIRIGATAGYLGQPVVFRQGLAGPVHPDSPGWKQNYNLNIPLTLHLNYPVPPLSFRNSGMNNFAGTEKPTCKKSEKDTGQAFYLRGSLEDQTDSHREVEINQRPL